VHARQVAIQHQDVVADHACLDQRIGPVRSQIHSHPLTTEPARNRIGKPALILSDQHAHRLSMTRGV
jgi:hypothetical protein